MLEKNLGQRLILIALIVLVGVIFLQQGLRPGLDIAGGTSLIFELDTSEAEFDPTLAERVKTHLQKRVDPNGVYDLNWRVHGKSRIEVQMPLPPKDAKERQLAYRDELMNLYEFEIGRGDLERALRAPAVERVAALRQLAKRNSEPALAQLQGEDAELWRTAIENAEQTRLDKLQAAAEQYDAYVAASAARAAGPETPAVEEGPTSAPATGAVTQEILNETFRDASELYEDATDEVLATNLNRQRFEQVLSLDAHSTVRKKSLEVIKEKQADLRGAIEVVEAAYDTWRSGKRFLDGSGDLKRLLRGAGKLEFRILAVADAGNPHKYDSYREQLEEGRFVRSQDEEGWFQVDNAMQFFNLDSPAALETFDHLSHDRFVIGMFNEDYYVLAKTSPRDGLLADSERPWQLKRARPERDQQGRLSVSFTLDTIGGSLFETLTRANIGQPLCILVDDVAYSAPNIQSAIRTQGQITGDFSADKIGYLVKTMEGGMLPGRLKDTPLSERTVGSSLGETNRASAVKAGIYGGIAVAALMLVYYMFAGAIANVALAMNVFLVLAAMAMLGARITLVGIGGIILAIGMAVDANVLVFERIREEKQRGASLRMMIKNGYDKALSTIMDSNITTLLTCVIIYYVGSEEVKGFGLTLGWGIVLNLFTSIFVTRTLFAVALKYNLIKDVKMMHMIGVPKIDWYAKRRIFLPISAVILVLGLGLLYQRGADNVFDVEFLGGVSAEFEVVQTDPPLEDKALQERIGQVGQDITAGGEALANAAVAAVADEVSTFTVDVPGVDNHQLAAMLAEPLEDGGVLQRGGGGIQEGGPEQVVLRVSGEQTAEELQTLIRGLEKGLTDAGKNLAQASINAVLEVGGEDQAGLIWNITTTVTNMRLVQYALETAIGEDLKTEPTIQYVFHGNGDAPYGIRDQDRFLDSVITDLPTGVNADLTDYLGGAVLHYDELTPPQGLAELTARLDNMHFQPDFEDMPKRKFEVLGIAPAGEVDGQMLYSSVAVVTVDPDIRYADDPAQWLAGFAQGEQQLVKVALEKEMTLRKVMQFKPQIAAGSQRQASLALILSWAMIITYLWIRFGKPRYGVAGVVALIHDALIALAFVGISGWIGGHDHPLGEFFLISDFKINMTIIAALLTIIGYSINDTIVVFDRIRETRGRMGNVTAGIVNDSINQTLSRTIMTSLTTLVILLVMYVFGGSSIRGFNFCMIIGVITGSYSSIAIAAPLLVAQLAGKSRAPAAARAS